MILSSHPSKSFSLTVDKTSSRNLVASLYKNNCTLQICTLVWEKLQHCKNATILHGSRLGIRKRVNLLFHNSTKIQTILPL